MQRFRRWLEASSALLALLALFSVPSLAQTFRGSINGTVTDTSGAVIPAAKFARAKNLLDRAEEKFYVIGRVAKGERRVQYT